MPERRRLLDFRALRRSDGALLLVLFLLVDAAIVALHLSLKVFGTPAGEAFDLGVDRSYGEMLMYVKLGWITVLGILLARRRRTAVFGAIAAGSLLLLLEDALILHERIGWHLNEGVLDALPALAGLGILSVQLGELLWLGVVGVTIVVLFVVSFLRAGPVDRRDALSIAVFFVAVGFFALVVDTAHSLFALGSPGDLFFTVLEDGGELIALTPAVALAFAFAAESASTPDQDQDSTTISSTRLSGLRPRQRA
ncbi:hypothetical protein [Microbacterium sp. CIAB417]|uniref:hypothetical protein n=1 Tax=Microbacterium sp. CIAB417 TaxID=2860287 RepID=UPI001FABE060|nr:hypothetical protein [Microbacterium sp. CIAB417]